MTRHHLSIYENQEREKAVLLFLYLAPYKWFSLSEMGSVLGYHVAALYRIVDRMVDRGLVYRIPMQKCKKYRISTQGKMKAGRMMSDVDKAAGFGGRI